MNNKHALYSLSNTLNGVANGCKQLLSLNTTRYRHFVDGSEKGFNCTYALITHRRVIEDRELPDVLELLDVIVSQANAARAQILAEQDNASKRPVLTTEQQAEIRALETGL